MFRPDAVVLCIYLRSSASKQFFVTGDDVTKLGRLHRLPEPSTEAVVPHLAEIKHELLDTLAKLRALIDLVRVPYSAPAALDASLRLFYLLLNRPPISWDGHPGPACLLVLCYCFRRRLACVCVKHCNRSQLMSHKKNVENSHLTQTKKRRDFGLGYWDLTCTGQALCAKPSSRKKRT